jgi:hypothetical protein
MKIQEVIGQAKYVSKLDSDINEIIVTMMANDIDTIDTQGFTSELKSLGHALSTDALIKHLSSNGKIKSANSSEIKLDTPSNDATFNKQDNTADKVSKLASKAAKSGIK